MNNRNLTIIAVILIAVTGTIAFINIRTIQSNTSIDYAGTTLTSGTPKVQIRNPLNLYIIGDDQFTEFLEKHITQTLEAEGIDVTILNELQEKYDNQTLVVMVAEKNIKYNPITPRAAVQTNFYYFSNGDTTYLEPLLNNQAVEMHDGPVLVQEGEIALSDASRGFASYPGYLDHLAQKTAENLMAHLPDE